MKKIIAMLLFLSFTCVNVTNVSALIGLDGEKEKWITSGVYQYGIVSEEKKIAALYHIDSTEPHIVIPETIDGYTVKYLGLIQDVFQYVHTEEELFSYTIMGKNYATMRSLKIPKTVTAIGDYAFSNCSNLETVIFPEKTRIEIGDLAFAGCSKIKNLTLYCGKVGQGTFGDLNRLELNGQCDLYMNEDECSSSFDKVKCLVLNNNAECGVDYFSDLVIKKIYLNDMSQLSFVGENKNTVDKLYVNTVDAEITGEEKRINDIYTIPGAKAISVAKKAKITYHIKSTGSMKKVTRKKSGKKYRYTWKKVKTTIKTHKYNWDKGKWKKTKKNIATQYQIYGKAKKSDTYQLMKTTKKRKFTTKYKYVKVKPVKIWLE